MFNTSLIHPITVHFPIALLIVAFVFEVMALLFKNNRMLSIVGFYLFLAGTLGAIVAVISGNLFTEDLTGPADKVLDNHHLFANVTMYLAIITSLFRIFLMVVKKEEISLKWVYFAAVFVTMITIGLTGYYGGSIVYDYMIKL